MIFHSLRTRANFFVQVALLGPETWFKRQVLKCRYGYPTGLCCGVIGKVVLWSKHFGIINWVSMTFETLYKAQKIQGNFQIGNKKNAVMWVRNSKHWKLQVGCSKTGNSNSGVRVVEWLNFREFSFSCQLGIVSLCSQSFPIWG